jgi:hypothetical protein
MALRASQFINAPYTITTTTANKTLENFEYCTVLPSTPTGPLTLTLPSAFVGNKVKVSVFNKTNVTLTTGSLFPIMNLAEDLTIDSEFATVELVYVDSNIGWRIS